MENHGHPKIKTWSTAVLLDAPYDKCWMPWDQSNVLLGKIQGQTNIHQPTNGKRTSNKPLYSSTNGNLGHQCDSKRNHEAKVLAKKQRSCLQSNSDSRESAVFTINTCATSPQDLTRRNWKLWIGNLQISPTHLWEGQKWMAGPTFVDWCVLFGALWDYLMKLSCCGPTSNTSWRHRNDDLGLALQEVHMTQQSSDCFFIHWIRWT